MLAALEWAAARRKAIAAYLIPAIIAAGGAMLPGSDGDALITAQELIVIVVAGLSCGTVVYRIPNRSKPAAE